MEQPEAQQPEKRSRKRSIYLILIILLLLVNGVLVFFYLKTDKEKDVVTAERMELDSLYSEVLKDLNAQELQIDSLSGQNAALDSVLAARMQDLQDQKQRIEELLRSNNVTRSQLAEARKLIEKLQTQTDQYVAAIDSLKEANAFLSENLERLNEELGEEIEKTERLQSEKRQLQEKVKIGSLLEAQNIEITGVRYRRSGKESSTRSAKRAEKIKVCFEVPENQVTDPGPKTVFIRLISPEGATIAIQSSGSGVLTLAQTGEQTQYTTKADFQYENQTKRLCAYWSQNFPFDEGTYEAIFYQDGYKIGESEFELR